jgi:hypothetical protein
MGKSGLSGFVVLFSAVYILACAHSAPDPYELFAGSDPTSSANGGANQITAGNGIANGGAVVAMGGNVTTGVGGRTTGNGGKILVAGGKTTTGAGGRIVTGTGGKTGTDGAGGVTGTGGRGATTAFFPKAYDSACMGDAMFGTNHYPNQECLACHFAWPFAGMVFQSNGSAGARNVEIGVKSGSTFYSTCTSLSGGMFLLRSGTINWTNAEVRIRNGKGEKSSMHAGGNLSGRCNAGGTCHGAAPLIEP